MRFAFDDFPPLEAKESHPLVAFAFLPAVKSQLIPVLSVSEGTNSLIFI